MSAKILPSLTEENRDLQKQIGCMNGIFQLFDRHYFLTGRRSTADNHKRLLAGANNNKETNNATEKATGNNLKEVTQDQPRLSTESLGTSFSSSSSSTFSSHDHGKTVQCRPSSLNQSNFLQNPTQIPVKHQSSSGHFSQQSPDLRDVVKGSMQREHRGISVKTTVKEEGKGRKIKHIDSPRPFQQLKNGQPIVADSDRSNFILAKLQESPWSSKQEKDPSLRQVRKDPPRFSYDGRESRDTLKSTTKFKELPRLSLDSREGLLRSSASESRLNFLLKELQRENGTADRIVNANQEPGSNKRPSSVVVKLMGLEAFPDSISNDEGATIKVNSYIDQDCVAKKSEKSKKNPALPQQIVHKDPASPGPKNTSVIMKPTSSPRFPLETAPWRQPDAIHDSPRTAPSIENGFRNVTQTSSSVYGEIEKRITELEFRKSGKDLRALKQILEAMQNTRKRLENQEGEQADLMSQTSRCSSNYKCCGHQGSKASNFQSNQNNHLAPTKATSSPKRFNSSVLITKSAKLMENGKISSASVNPSFQSHPKTPTFLLSISNPFPSAYQSFLPCILPYQKPTHLSRIPLVKAANDNQFSSRRSSSNEPRETIMLPGCDYNHWLIVMEFPKDPAPTREQMIDTYLDTLATVIGSMEEAKKNMYAFSTTTYTGFQCTVDEETSEKFKGLPGVLWVLPDSYIDVKNKDYGGDKYVNGEIIPCQYPTYQPKQSNRSKYKSKAYVRRRDGTPPERRRPTQGATTESASQ